MIYSWWKNTDSGIWITKAFIKTIFNQNKTKYWRCLEIEGFIRLSYRNNNENWMQITKDLEMSRNNCQGVSKGLKKFNE